MTIDWNTIKSDVADALDAALVAANGQAFAKFPMPEVALSASYTWNGTSTVTTSDTSEVTVYDPGDPPPSGTTPVTPASYIKLDSDGNWYKVISITTDTSVTVQDTYGIGSFPSGSSGSSKALNPPPSPPAAGSFKDKLATPIADTIFDGVEEALDQAEISGTTSGSDTIGPGVIS